MTTTQNYDRLWGIFASIKNEVSNIKSFPENSCAIFDIDGTLIDTACNPILPVVDFYDYLKRIGFKIFIVTARTNKTNVIAQTKKQLENAQVTNYEKIYFRDNWEKDICKFKEDARREIKNTGNFVVFSIGDNSWDVGIYGGIGILI